MDRITLLVDRAGRSERLCAHFQSLPHKFECLMFIGSLPPTECSTAAHATMPGLLACEPDLRSLCTPLAGNGKLLSIMRVNNDMLCDLAAIVEFDDSSLLPAVAQPEVQQTQQQQEQQEAAQKGQLQGRFLRYTFVPGLGVGHPAILYDEVRTVAYAQQFGWLGACGEPPTRAAATLCNSLAACTPAEGA